MGDAGDASSIRELGDTLPRDGVSCVSILYFLDNLQEPVKFRLEACGRNWDRRGGILSRHFFIRRRLLYFYRMNINLF